MKKFKFLKIEIDVAKEFISDKILEYVPKRIKKDNDALMRVNVSSVSLYQQAIADRATANRTSYAAAALDIIVNSCEGIPELKDNVAEAHGAALLRRDNPSFR